MKKELIYKRVEDLGSTIEPEMIDFHGDDCYYTDHNGNVYRLFLD